VTGQEGLSRRRAALALARGLVTVALIVVIYYIVPLRATVDVGTLVRLAAGLVAVAVLLTWQVRMIARSPYPALRAAETLAVAIPVFLLIFAATYAAMSAAQPASFSEEVSRTGAIYFVVTVFSTVGFGDIHPVSDAARIVVTVQMVADLLLVGFVLRALLNAVDRGRKHRDAEAL
jgi:voltage-gated potassium channel